MKKNLFIIITLTLFYITSAQNKGIITYGQIESVSLKGPYGPDFNAYLAFNNNGSYYVSSKDSLDLNTEFKDTYDNKDGSHALGYSQYTTKNGKQVYYNKKKDSTYWNQWVNFYVAEKTPKINWKLHSEIKQIGKFTVNKATGFFRGRTYTAWYTLEIPLPYGPWKLQGLPGLMLEAYDTDKELYCYFKSLEYPTTRHINVEQIKLPEGLNTIKWRSLNDFKKRINWIYERMKSTSIMIAQKYETDVPEEKIKSEALLESFPE